MTEYIKAIKEELIHRLFHKIVEEKVTMSVESLIALYAGLTESEHHLYYQEKEMKKLSDIESMVSDSKHINVI